MNLSVHCEFSEPTVVSRFCRWLALTILIESVNDFSSVLSQFIANEFRGSVWFTSARSVSGTMSVRNDINSVSVNYVTDSAWRVVRTWMANVMTVEIDRQHTNNSDTDDRVIEISCAPREYCLCYQAPSACIECHASWSWVSNLTRSYELLNANRNRSALGRYDVRIYILFDETWHQPLLLVWWWQIRTKSWMNNNNKQQQQQQQLWTSANVASLCESHA